MHYNSGAVNPILMKAMLIFCGEVLKLLRYELLCRYKSNPIALVTH